MKFNFLFSVSLTSLSLIGAIVPYANAQERPQCYLIDNSGLLSDLSDICNASQRQSSVAEPTTNEGLNIINNNSNVVGSEPLDYGNLTDNAYFLGEGSNPVGLSPFSSSYYIDNEIGNNYTAYLRSYRTSPNYLPRQVIRDQTFRFDRFDNYFDPYSLTSILRRGQNRVPYIIYRYPVR